jgi:Lecithin:cholesterol acyltransferase
MSDSIVIGIHGLKNKPAHILLQRWWATSVQEGLQRNRGATVPFDFELVYWANVQYPDPIQESDIDNPYLKAHGDGPLPRYDAGLFSKARAFAENWGGRSIDKGKDLLGLDKNIDELIGMDFDDLRDYYRERDKRTRIRGLLADALQRHRNKRVCLLAHSMGSIIAYDVLRTLETSPPTIEQFVTIGSPLGLPIVAQHVREEFGQTTIPQEVRHWSNLADPGDRVALDCTLADEYRAASGAPDIHDTLVLNGYADRSGKTDPHNGYGYLRAPELADIVHTFLMA